MPDLIVTTLADQAFDGDETVDNPDDGGLSLREALGLLNSAAHDPTSTITFQDGLTGTLTLTQGQLLLDRSVSIDGTGITISGDGNYKILEITGTRDVALEGLTLANAYGNTDGGSIDADRGTLTLRNASVTNGFSGSAGGLPGIFTAGNLTLIGTTLSNLSETAYGTLPSSEGGAAAHVLGDLVMVDSHITSNTTVVSYASSFGRTVRGGAIYVRGDADITGGTVSGNSLTREFGNASGGALYVGGRLTMTDTIVSGNEVSAYGNAQGGGIAGRAMEFIDVTIADNTAVNTQDAAGSAIGGGVRAGVGFTMTGGTVSGNTADGGGGSSATGGGLQVGSGSRLVGVTIDGNAVSLDGDSINDRARGGGVHGYNLTVVGSTISNNTTESSSSVSSGGGGVFGSGTFINTTVHGNAAIGSDGFGGGVFVGRETTLVNTTITGNASSGDGGGVFVGNNLTTQIANSIIAGNAADDGSDDLAGDAQDIEDSGGNVISTQAATLLLRSSNTVTDDLASIFQTVQSGSLAGQDFSFGALANNGGSVETVLIARGGAAVDAGDAANLPADTEDIDGDDDTTEDLPLDAIGAARAVNVGTGASGVAPDAGTVELQPIAPYGTLTVTTLEDQAFDGGTLHEETADGGALSLREALGLINLAVDDPDTAILFDAALSGTMTLSGSSLLITKSVSIMGNGRGETVISAYDAAAGEFVGRVFTIDGSSVGEITVSLGDMTLRDGDGGEDSRETGSGGIISADSVDLTLVDVAISGGTAESGGGVFASSSTSLTIERSLIGGNTASGSNAQGAGLWHRSGSLKIIDSTITNNTADGNVGAEGGGVWTRADITITGSTLSGNTVQADTGDVSGGGIHSEFGALAISDSTIADNLLDVTADGSDALGGGIFQDSGSLALVRSTVDGNTAGGGTTDTSEARAQGGGLRTLSADVEIVSSTISNNTVVSGSASYTTGGGVSLVGGNAAIINATIVGNTLDSVGTSYGGGASIFDFGPSSTTQIINSTIAGNTSDFNSAHYGYVDAVGNSIIVGNAASSPTASIGTDVGGNVVSSALVSNFDNFQSTVEDDLAEIFDDVSGGVPVLADNGGPVLTALIRGNGAAADAGEAANLMLAQDLADLDGDDDAMEALPLDARGEARSIGLFNATNDGPPDAGAVELLTPPPLVVTTLDDDGFDGGTLEEETADGGGLSLREALAFVNDASESTDTAIIFRDDVTGTLTLTEGVLEIEKSVTITGLGQANTVIDANSNSGVFLISGSGASTVVLEDMEVREGFSDNGGNIAASAADVTLSNVTATRGGAIYGGNIYATDGATLTIVNSTISSGYAFRFGGGIFTDGALILSSSVVRNNSADAGGGTQGGGVYAHGGGTIKGSQILGNAAVSDGNSGSVAGGGLHLAGGFLIESSFISGNAAENGNATSSSGAQGAGIYADGDLAITDTVISNNSAVSAAGQAAGGGLIHRSGDLTIVGSSIQGNTVDAEANEARGAGIAKIFSGGFDVINSTIAGNILEAATQASGAGLYVFDEATLINTTLHGNTIEADGQATGGGVQAQNLTLIQSTVTVNAASGDTSEGGGVSASGTLTAANSIVVGNFASGTTASDADAAAGTVENEGGNVLSTQAAGVIGTNSNTVEDDLSEIFAELALGSAVLADNGGPVETVALNADGVAVDAGDAGNLPEDTEDLDDDGNIAEPLPVDARGFDRAVDGETGGKGAPDAGAVEVLGLTLVVDTLVDEEFQDGVDNAEDGEGLSLREAIALAASTPGGDTITFDPSLQGETLVLTRGPLTIGSAGVLTIDGDTDGDLAADVTISGNNVNNHLRLAGGNLTLSALNFVDGFATLGGSILASNGAALTVEHSTFSDNGAALGGGAIFAVSVESVAVKNSTFEGNEANTATAIGVSADNFSMVNTTVVGPTVFGSTVGNLVSITADVATVQSSTLVGTTDDGVVLDLMIEDDGTASLNNNIVVDTASRDEPSVLSIAEAGNGSIFVDVSGGNILGTERFNNGVSAEAGITFDDVFETGTLSDNGGAVETLLLADEGPAVDAGDNSLVSEATDARGPSFDRIVAGTVDLGALERQDFPPIFEGSLADGSETVTLPENSLADTPVFDVDANDGDGGATDEGVTYAIIAGNTERVNFGSRPFAIDFETGEITVNDRADMNFELGETFTLTVQADNGLAQRTAIVVVELQDINDAPSLRSLDNAPTYEEGGAAVVLDGDATVFDEDLDALNGGDGNYNGTTLTLQRQGGAVDTDVFGFFFGPASLVGLIGSSFVVGGVTVATLASAGGVATITFTDANGAVPTTDIVNAILQAATYEISETSLGVGEAATATIEYTFQDGTGVSNGTTTGTVEVTITPDLSSNAVVLSAAADTFNSTNSDGQLVAGLAGADFILTSSGDDFLLGGMDADILRGAGGDDTLVGGSGNDVQTGGEGDDTFEFRASDSSVQLTIDTITDLEAGDIVALYGFTAQSFDALDIDTDNFSQGAVIFLSDDQWLLFEGIFDEAELANTFVFDSDEPALPSVDESVSVSLSAGSDSFQSAGTEGITVAGLSGADFIVTFNGDDSLLGGADADILRGGAGRDTLLGGAGNDMLTGGADSDLFRFSGADDGPVLTIDTITDFDAADTILLEDFGAIDYNDAFAMGIVIELSDTQWVLVSGATQADVEDQLLLI